MSSSAYPIIWSMKHAPVTDAIERAILFALSDFGDPDGCDCFPSVPTVAKVAMTSERTVQRKCGEMAKRGLIRPQPGPPPARWLKLPADRRPTVWEVMIPCSWWSPSQLEEVNRMREQRGREPITPESRPDIAPAPAKAPRSDKGKPNPKRSRPKKAAPAPENTPQEPDPADSQERGDTETPLWITERGDTETPREVTQRHPAGCLEDTQPSCVHPPVEPSFETPPSSAGTAARLGDARAGAKAPSANGEQKQRKERRATPRQNASPQARQILGEIPAAFREGAPPSIIRTMSLRIDRMLDGGWSRGAIIGAAVDVAEARNIDGDHIAAMRALQAALIGNAPGRHCDHCGRARLAEGAYCTAGCDAFTVDPGAVPEEIDPDQLARVMEDLGAST